MTVYNKSPLSREDVAALFLQPVEAESLAFQTCTVLRTDGYELRIPTVLADPSVGFYNEGQEIAPSDPTLGELVVVPRKVAGLTVLSSEAANDSSPAAAEVVGAGLARSVAAKIDEAFYGPGLAAPAPSGLGALTGFAAVSAGSTAGGTVYVNTDAFAEAISRAQEVGATLDAFVTSPATALRLAKIKSGNGSKSRCSARTRPRPASGASSASTCACRRASPPTSSGATTPRGSTSCCARTPKSPRTRRSSTHPTGSRSVASPASASRCRTPPPSSRSRRSREPRQGADAARLAHLRGGRPGRARRGRRGRRGSCGAPRRARRGGRGEAEPGEGPAQVRSSSASTSQTGLRYEAGYGRSKVGQGLRPKCVRRAAPDLRHGIGARPRPLRRGAGPLVV